MGQAATLYRIGQDQFNRLQNNSAGFTIKMTLDHKTFDQNFEGLIFLLTKVSPSPMHDLIHEIFYPGNSLGDATRFEQGDFDPLSDEFAEPIRYLNTENIRATKLFLDGVDERQLLSMYDSKELNDNGIYPGVWHNDESADQAFNRRHIQEGFQSLKQLFDEAVEEKSIVLVFVG
jgi:hypothetical protein